MGKLLRRKCEMKKSDLKFRLIASKPIFPPETQCRFLTILNPSLEATWREVLIISGFQVVDNLEIQTSNYFKKGGIGWTTKLNDKVGAFVEKYTRKKNEYLIKVRPCQVENNDNMENFGDGDGENVVQMDVDEVKIEIEGVPNEDQGEEEDEEADDGFLVPKISNVQSLNEENGEELEEGDELDDDLVRRNFGKISNALLLRTKAELEKLKTRDPERWRRAVSTAPPCWGFLQGVLEVPE